MEQYEFAIIWNCPFHADLRKGAHDTYPTHVSSEAHQLEHLAQKNWSMVLRKTLMGPLMYFVFCCLWVWPFFFKGNVYQYISPIPGYLSDVSFSFVLMKLLLVLCWY